LCNDITIVSSGDIKLILAAKVDVRDGLAWSSLDKYIKNIEGRGQLACKPTPMTMLLQLSLLQALLIAKKTHMQVSPFM